MGRIGWRASIVTLGGCGLGEISQKKADEAVKMALRYGVNTVDVAPSYGQAELRLAPWVKKYRNRLFVAEKTTERSKEGAWTELRRSLRRLSVSSFDLYQLHAVGDLQELKTALGKDGAIRAFKEAKETGLINHIGITGHKDMRVLKRAMERFDFDSILLRGRFNLLTPTVEHVIRSARLPWYHRDPFDRLLVAQSLELGWSLLSKDEILDAYGVRRIWS